MKKYIAVFDIDQTIYPKQSALEVIEFFINQKVVDSQLRVQVKTLVDQYYAGEKTYGVVASEVLSLFASSLKKQKYTTILDLTKEFFEQKKHLFYPYFAKSLPNLQATHDVYLVTANAQFVAQVITEMFGLSGYLSTVFTLDQNQKFTGAIDSTLGQGKSSVGSLLQKYSHAGSIAVGDSENDIGMLELVEHPVCFCPNEKLKTYAQQHGWTVVGSSEEAEGVFFGILGG